MSYSHRDNRMCPVLTGTIMCVLFSLGQSNVTCYNFIYFIQIKIIYLPARDVCVLSVSRALCPVSSSVLVSAKRLLSDS